MSEALTPSSNGKGGRPRLVLTEDQLRQIETLAGYGLTVPQIAAVIDVSERTLRAHNDQEYDPAVSAAFSRGRAKAEGMVGRALYRRAVGDPGDKENGIPPTPPDVAAIKWWEMTRANRVEKQHIRIGRLEEMTDEQLRALAEGRTPE